MLPELEPIAEGWQRVTDYLVELANVVDDSQWNAPSGYPGWTNKDLLTHLAEGYVVRIGWLEAAVGGRKQPERQDIDDVNAERIQAAAGLEADEIAKLLRGNRDRFLELLSALEPEHLDIRIERSGPPPFLQPLREFLTDEPNSHDLEHAEDLKRSTGVTLDAPSNKS